MSIVFVLYIYLYSNMRNIFTHENRKNHTCFDVCSFIYTVFLSSFIHLSCVNWNCGERMTNFSSHCVSSLSVSRLLFILYSYSSINFVTVSKISKWRARINVKMRGKKEKKMGERRRENEDGMRAGLFFHRSFRAFISLKINLFVN